jgi:hypothetical protein
MDVATRYSPIKPSCGVESAQLPVFDRKAHGRGTAIPLKRAHAVSALGPCRPPRHSHRFLRRSSRISHQGIWRRGRDEEGRWRNQVVAGSRRQRVRAIIGHAVLTLNFHAFDRVDAEWISAKKDWQDAQKRAKEGQGPVAAPKDHRPERPEPGDPILNDIVLEPLLKLEGEAGHPSVASNSKGASTDSASYQPEMDEMRCILYAHGGMAPLISR